MLDALGFFALLEAAGLAAAPLAALVLGRLPGAGLGFAKVLGVLLVGWLAWMAASIGLADYGPLSIVAAFAVVAAMGALAGWRLRQLGRRLRAGGEEPRGRFARWRRSRLAARALPADDPVRLRLWAGSEAVFAVTFAAMALLVAYAPDVWNTEKPMDAMLMTAIQASDGFPPQDAWMAGETVNYYYLGHLLLALPAHVLGLEPSVAYNLAVAALFALSASAVFTLAGSLWAAALARGVQATGGPVGAGWTGLVLLAAFVRVLPFWLNFDPAARGIGWVGERLSFTDWAWDTTLIYGVLGWAVLAAYAGRLLSARRRERIAVWGGVGAAFVLSLLAPIDFAGVALLLAALTVALHAALTRRLEAPERFLWLLIAVATACLLAPELVYVRDEFDGSDLYRMNTVFKLGYQAFLLLAIAAACALPWAGRWLPRRAWTGWAAIGAVLLLLGLVFPYAGNWARREGFSRGPTLDGLGWLRASAPGDVAAIAWLRANAPDDAVLLEAAGPDYSGFGHARMSTFTGRPTVIGWAGHELQWKHDPGTRAADVRQ